MDFDPVSMVTLRAALLGGEPDMDELLAAAFQRHTALTRRSEAGIRALASVDRGRAQLAAIGRQQQRRGVWWDTGQPVSESFKRDVMARWQQARDEHNGRTAARQPTVMASAAGGMSPVVARIFGLD